MTQPQQETDDQYLKRMRDKYTSLAGEARKRSEKPQDGIADLPLFHTDLEEFTL